MNREKMGKVAAVARIAEQNSARELNVATQSHQQQSDQLAQLVQYKEDYETSLGSAAEKGMSAMQLQDYRLFMGKLNQAIDKQAEQVEVAGQGLADSRAAWISTSQRHSALEQLLQTQYRKELLARDKAEQKESDEKSMVRGLINQEE